MSDRIRLCNMRFYAYHGVFEWERTTGQPFELDVELRLDLAPAGLFDDLARTVDYAAVYALVREIVEKERHKLIESLAETVAARILSGFSLVATVVVRVRKPGAALGGLLGTVEVEIERRRAPA